jgi:hypothetical protein
MTAGNTKKHIKTTNTDALYCSTSSERRHLGRAPGDAATQEEGGRGEERRLALEDIGNLAKHRPQDG